MSAYTYPIFLVYHKIISLMASQFDLTTFTYRYTVVLFVAYIYSGFDVLCIYIEAAHRSYYECFCALKSMIDNNWITQYEKIKKH